MEDAFAVRVLNGARDLGDERDALPRIVSQSRGDFLQAAARREFHAEERKAVFAFAYFVDRQNVRMIEARGGLRFATKTRQGFAGVGVITQDPLYGDNATGMALARAVDHSHSAAADFLEDLVVAEPPVLVWEGDFREGGYESVSRTLVVGLKPGLEQATHTKSAGDIRGGIAMRTWQRVCDHARDRIGKSGGNHGRRSEVGSRRSGARCVMRDA